MIIQGKEGKAKVWGVSRNVEKIKEFLKYLFDQLFKARLVDGQVVTVPLG